MLHVTVIILVCFTVPAPSEGIAVTRPKFEDFCLFEGKIPKVAEVSSFSIYNVDEEEFSDCVKNRITYRLSFFKNIFINQYRNRKNNYCSIMDNVLETKKKKSRSSEELNYRKRNLLWTRKGLNSLKTLKPLQSELTTTTPKPLEHHTLNFIEKKRFFAIKKAKTFKRKGFRRHARRRHSGGKLKNLRKQNYFSGPPLKLSNVAWKDYFEGKPLQAFPPFHNSENFIKHRRNRGSHGSGSRFLRRKDSAPAEAIQIIYKVPKFTQSHSCFSNKLRENARSGNVENLNKENRLLGSTSNERFIQRRKRKKIRSRPGIFHSQLKTLPLMKNYMASLNQLIYDSRFKGNDESDIKNSIELSLTTETAALNDRTDIEEVQYSNKQERKNDYDNKLDTSGFNPGIKLSVPDCLADRTKFKTKQELANAVRLPDFNEGFNSAEESTEFRALESTIRKPFLSRRRFEKEIPITDFDFPDYDEIYDKTPNRFQNTYIPFHILDRRKFKFWKNPSSKKKYSKIHEKLRSDSNCQTPLNFKRSPFFKKLDREKKFCGTKYSDSCSVPHRCWKSAPLLCIPYIRKGQDDLLKYLIGEMQKMLGKPYPQKIDIFDNTKYKPNIKKPPSNTCEDIMPHEPDDNEDDDIDENCDPSKLKSSSQSCESCTRNCHTTPAPCPPSACAPAPTPCSSCPKGCVKSPNEPSCPPFPCPLPNLNQIYTEPTPCTPDKCFSTLPPFLLSVSSIAGAQKDLSNKPAFISPSPKPTELTVKSLSSNSNTPAIVTPKVPKELESLTFFPPKKVALGYVKNAKQINSDSLAGDNQLQPDQRLNDKMLPELMDYQEEMKLENVTKNASESSIIASTSNEPFLFELPKFISDEKLPLDFSSSNITNTFKGRDLNFDFEYNDQISGQNNPTNFSPNTVEQIIHQNPSKKQHLEGNDLYNPFSANENDVPPKFPGMPTQVHDGPQIDKPLHMKHSRGRFIQLKKRKFLKRQKREDDYYVDDFINNDGYFYDARGNNEDYEKQSLQQPSNLDESRLSDDYDWTPMQNELFSELAKMVTATEANDISSSEPISYTPKPSKTDLTTEISSTAKTQLETNSVALTTEKSLPSVLPDEPSTNKSTTVAESQQKDTTLEYKQTKTNDVTRFNTRSSSTVDIKETYSERQEKPLDVNTYIDTTEDGQVLTTVGSAYIVKGPKKQMTKPCPKMFTKVYPDSVPIENGVNDTTVTTTDSTTKVQTTLAVTSVTPDVKLQLLAVCEGYLEVMKVMKSQNQSFAGDLDSDLIRYCESIISQSLTQQTESSKSKKQEFNLSPTKRSKSLQNTSKKYENLMPESKSYDSLILGDSVLKRELDSDKKIDIETFNGTTAERNENTESPYWKKKQNLKKSKMRKKEFQQMNDKISESDDEFLKKGMTKDQVELLSLLKKRKRALLNWLFNSKEDRVQPEVEETEYFDDGDDDSLGNSLNHGNSSGTVRPRGAKSAGKTNRIVPVNTKDSVIPVYAKEYGYDKGGQLKQVQVLWRRFNDQTNEKQTLKNLSVLALVLTSTAAPDIFKKYNNFFDINGFANEDMSETRTKNENKVGFAAEEVQSSNNISVSEKPKEYVKTTSPANTTVVHTITTHTPSVIESLINHTINTTKHPNITRKIAGNLNKAKGIVEEYTIEFWNYAVYILPITFSILFCFCCACCTIHILRNKKSKKRKKKKKKFESTDEEEASTDGTDSEPKKRRDKFKKSKNIWKVWKKNGNDDGNQPEKSKSFLRFMKSKKNDKAGEGSSVPYSAVPESDGRKEDTQSEAAERRELIALLEELKKIEMEQAGEKKEQKSVHVQYMIQDQDESVFKRPEMSYNYPFYSRLHEPIAEEYRIYKDAELNELLPCGCGFRSKNRDFLRNCDFQRNEENRCGRFFDIIRNAGMCHHELAKNKKFTDRDRNLIFDRYRNVDINDKRNEAGFAVKVCDMPALNLPAGNPNDWVRRTEGFNNQMMKKKPVRLKDDGVLCRL